MEQFNETDSETQQYIIFFATFLTIAPATGGWLLFSAVRNNAIEWIKTLKFPKILLPPRWLRIFVWIVVYCSVDFASFIVYYVSSIYYDNVKIPLMLYIIQLSLNWGFILIFFGAHKLRYSFYEILLLDITATVCAVSFYSISPIAGLLFVPYILWHLFATTFVYVVYRNNNENRTQYLQSGDFMKAEMIGDA